MSAIVVGFGHIARSGKDSAAAALVEKLGFRKIAFADALRQMALRVNPIIEGKIPGFPERRLADLIQEPGDWEQAKNHYPEVRRFLQALGTEGVRETLGHDIWTRVVMDQIHLGDRVVIPDVRYVNEAETIQARGGLVIRVDRPNYVASGHSSETALADWDGWDDVLENSSSWAMLRQRAVELVTARFLELAPIEEPEADDEAELEPDPYEMIVTALS